MKNIQVIDGAQNCTYDIFALTDNEFAKMFPKNRDIEFINDFIRRVGRVQAELILDAMWQRRVKKSEVAGIHGTLFYELDFKKEFYPSKKESEMVTGIGTPSNRKKNVHK